MNKNDMKVKPIIYLILLLGLSACHSNSTNQKLPILGRHQINGEDTIYHKVPDFVLVDQDGDTITRKFLEGKIYIVDDFFTSCPTICPKVKRQELRLFEKFKHRDVFHMLSISIDHRRDSVPRLKNYSDKLGINGDRWHLTTGNKDHIYEIINEFFLIAIETEDAPGGYDHSGALILVDDQSRIRAVCSDGTNAEEVDKFMLKIEQLLDEIEPDA
jgi:protein SCO1/2